MGKKQHVGPSKQNKKIKKQKEAKEQADAIIAEAVQRIKDRPKTKYDDERKEGIDDAAWILGARVRELREQGEPWWAIARDLELEGFGQSATTGKKGAARARSAYKAAFGEFPRTFKRGGYKGRVETNEHVAALKKQKKTELKAQALGGKPVIDPNMPDEEIAAMLKGRHIKWVIKGDICPDGMEQEAYVHPTTPFYVYEDNGRRVVEFREREPRAPIQYRLLPSRTRTVDVNRIFSVK